MKQVGEIAKELLKIIEQKSNYECQKSSKTNKRVNGPDCR